ncbi:hypothetical protein ACFVHB_24265 [Kitasatospora sp. NPDC127111]|uniref:RCC1 domain-containing protein n=1 Tax=Kitasatospora sp. NPDC127111 TaxID=3345363 RepID=UPI00363F5DE2
MPCPEHRLRPLGSRPALRGTLLVVVALLAALLLPGGWHGAHAATGGKGRDIRPGVPGTALAWGNNRGASLGDGATVDHSTTPGRVCGGAPCTGPLQDVVSISSGGFHTLALRSDGTVLAWGENGVGQLGDGTTSTRTTPVPVCAPGATAPCSSFLTDVVAVSAGAAHSLALRADGTVLSWGYNSYGQLGNGTTTDSPVPVEADLGTAVAIAAGGYHSLAVTTSGVVLSWGYNSNGQLGTGSNNNASVPQPVCTPVLCDNYVQNAAAVAAGSFHSLVLNQDGTVLSFGANGYGQLGDGTTTDRNIPVQVCDVGGCGTPLSGITALDAGYAHSLALRSGGFVRAWGLNSQGQLGDGTNTNSPLPVRVCAVGVTTPCGTFLSGISAVAAGDFHSLALRTDGGVSAWGENASFGALGDGTTTNRNKPVRVCAVGQTAPCSRLLDGVTAIDGGNTFSTAITQPLADLAVSVSASPEPVANGANLTYTVTVRNSGPTAAENVTLTDTVPANARFVSATPGAGSCTTPPAGSTDTVKCSLGTVASGASVSTTIVVKAVAGSGSTITTTARAAGSTPDPDPDNNTATITTPVS